VPKSVIISSRTHVAERGQGRAMEEAARYVRDALACFVLESAGELEKVTERMSRDFIGEAARDFRMRKVRFSVGLDERYFTSNGLQDPLNDHEIPSDDQEGGGRWLDDVDEMITDLRRIYTSMIECIVRVG
jgi:hypothetical protein